MLIGLLASPLSAQSADELWRRDVAAFLGGSMADRASLRRSLMQPERFRPRAPLLRAAARSARTGFLRRQALLVLWRAQPQQALAAARHRLSVGRGDDLPLVLLIIGSLGGPQDLPLLMGHLDAPNVAERAPATLALGLLRSPRSLAMLLETSLRPATRDRERAAALLALALAHQDSGAEAAETLLRSPSRFPYPVRRAALLALARGGSVSEVETLALRFARDSDHRVRRVAHLVLASLPGRVTPQGATPTLALPRPSGIPERALALHYRLQRGDPKLRAERWLAASEDPSPRIREAAAVALSAWQPAAQALRFGLVSGSDPRPEVRIAAQLALALQPGWPLPSWNEKGLSASLRLDLGIAREGLEAVKLKELPNDPQLRKAVRELWVQRRAEALADEHSLRSLAIARLQVRLDQTGLAPSWLLAAELQEALEELLGIEDAAETIGGGEAPGGRGPGSGAAGPKPSASTFEQDLATHFEHFPLALRPATLRTELPLPRR